MRNIINELGKVLFFSDCEFFDAKPQTGILEGLNRENIRETSEICVITVQI